jgi:hypothetical protein
MPVKSHAFFCVDVDVVSYSDGDCITPIGFDQGTGVLVVDENDALIYAIRRCVFSSDIKTIFSNFAGGWDDAQ